MYSRRALFTVIGLAATAAVSVTAEAATKKMPVKTDAKTTKAKTPVHTKAKRTVATENVGART